MPGRNYNASDYRFGHGGQEKTDEISGVGNHYTALFWEMDPRILRRWNQDPKPNPSISNYAIYANNPIWFVDVLGDTAYQFRLDGSFFRKFDDGKKDVIGQFFQTSTSNYDKDGNLTSYTYSDPVNFTFNDLDLDREAIVSGSMKATLITENDIDAAMDFNGVKTPEAQNSPWTYIERESRPVGDESILSGKSTGLLDHYSTSPIVKSGYLHVVKPASGSTGFGAGYNDMDFGNFLWGHSGKMLGFSLITLKSTAHLNNAVNGRSDNPGKDVPLLDAEADQRAIKGGYNYPVK